MSGARTAGRGRQLMREAPGVSYARFQGHEDGRNMDMGLCNARLVPVSML